MTAACRDASSRPHLFRDLFDCDQVRHNLRSYGDVDVNPDDWESLMHCRYQPPNVSIEVVRTIVAVSEAGSLTKAAERLGLSQPVVSSQVQRIQNIVGGALFTRSTNGSAATQLGKLVLHQARRIIEANDRMLRIGSTPQAGQSTRLGISSLFVREFLQRQSAMTPVDVVIHADDSVAITQGLVDGSIDIAYILENPELTGEISHFIVNERDEEFVWVRSKDFVLSPESPIPLLTWPGDDIMARTLTRHGLSYKIVFDSPDYHAKLAAAEAGIGITAIPRRMMPPTLVRAQELDLPRLPTVKALLCARAHLDSRQNADVLNEMSALFFKPPQTVSI